MTDWVVPVRKGENEELRYAIRSWVANGGLRASDTLYVVGHKPDWLTNVEFIEGNKHYDSPRNVYWNIRYACQQIPGRVVIANDDFFLMRRTNVERTGYRGLLTDHIDKTNPHSPWGKSLRTTLKFLRHHGYDEPLSYELHRPIVVDTQHMEKALRNVEKITPTNPPQWRTVYGNLYRIEAKQMEDGKVFGANDSPRSNVLSTTDKSWETNMHARKVVEKFKRKSRYER